MPRKTGFQNSNLRRHGIIGFNEAAARCRGKPVIAPTGRASRRALQ